MNPRSLFVLIILLALYQKHYAQTGIIKGRVYNSVNNEAIPFANIYIDSIATGTVSDMDGNYQLSNLAPGTYNVVCSFIGFQEAKFYEVRVSPVKPVILDIALLETGSFLGEVVISASPFNRKEESPLSLRTIGSEEIYRNPGGNRDISKVIQILPGVSSTLSFRNDIIVRGGAPNENRFFLDGIEVPNINHFSTQGSSGGPVGMINVNFIRDVDFYAGAFPANRGNAMSSVIEFNQREGNNEKPSGTFMLGSSDIGFTYDGPLGRKSSLLLSLRRSYLQLLFKALALPFLPTYNDMQYKHTIRLNDKNKVTIIGLGAIDDFELNKKVNKGLSDQDVIERNNYILGYLPVNTQWNYTIGGKWTHFSKNSYQEFIASRNHLENKTVKYKDNIEEPANLILDYKSAEMENKFQFIHTYRQHGWKSVSGIGFEFVRYTNSTYNQKEINSQIRVIDFNSELDFRKYFLFTQLSKSIIQNKLTLSLGLRSDFNDYSGQMADPFKQVSPRFSASYALSEKLNLNFNTAKYFQLPAYTVLGYRDSSNILVNKENDISYINSVHIVAGLEYNPTTFSKISVEGFHKIYTNYPFLINDSISLANLGGDFGVIGNEPAVSTSKGRSYGVELLLQQKLSTSVYGILSYTFVRSEFSDKSGNLVPSAWDNRHILNMTAGKKFAGNLELGFKFRLLGGSPYTPYDKNLSSLKSVWNINQQAIPDYSRLNQERNPLSHGLDIRLDKKWFFNKWLLNAYLDLQNIYNFQARTQSFLTLSYDQAGNPVTDPGNPDAYLLKEIENTTGTFLPSVGIMIEF
jgi:outer membrane receptor for ferrienterochelin and colicin